MTSAAHRSESELAEWVCGDLTSHHPRVLIGGLGLGYTLRAALDALPRRAAVRVAEIEPAVVAWCRGPLAPLTGGAVADPRVEVVVADVMESVQAAARSAIARFDAIALDLFEGPRGSRRERDHPLWGDAALALMRDALAPRGALGIWCEEPAPGLERRLARAGLSAELRRAGRGGRRHALYRARASSSRPGSPNRPA
ncbi:MAG TPA: spermidine synthase [Myxococcota bacterium]|nr:spermidine synthase [Myxococcota bacterium]